MCKISTCYFCHAINFSESIWDRIFLLEGGVKPRGNVQGIGEQEQDNRINSNTINANRIGTEGSPHEALQNVVHVFRSRCSTMEDTDL